MIMGELSWKTHVQVLIAGTLQQAQGIDFSISILIGNSLRNDRSKDWKKTPCREEIRELSQVQPC
ncbi:hypothetical protein GCM10028774_08530 [Spirosoma jeollabukense]